MVNRLISLALLMFILLAAGSCAGGDPPGTNQPPLPEVTPAIEAGSSAGLPALADLPVPAHGATALEQGWLDIHPSDPSYLLAGSGISAIPASLTINGAGSTAFALFGVDGFDGDNSPSALRLTGFGYTGEYYIACSCYSLDKWVFTGPFTGNTEAVIPGTAEIPMPGGLTSGNGTFYFAVIAAAGSSLLLTNLELGVHGGNLAPAPIASLTGDSGSAGIILRWTPSADSNRPDFAGYVVERAPLTIGNYLRLTPEPVSTDYFIDDTVAAATLYRYRVAAVDVAGNMSSWKLALINSGLGSSNDPVAILDLPDGPLYGPVDVTFDMGASFDPEGIGIDTFQLMTGYTDELYLGPAESATVTLQPGCHNIICRVFAGARQGVTYHFLKVYPQWQPDSVVVADSGGCGIHCPQFRSAIHPVTGVLTYYAQDLALPGLSSWRETGPQAVDHRCLPINGELLWHYLGEPVAVNGLVMLPVNLDGYIAVMVDDGTEISWLSQYIAYTDGESVALVATPDSAELWVLYVDEGPPGNFKIMSTSLVSDQDEILIDSLPALPTFDAIWNPAAASIDLAYTDLAGPAWVRFTPGTGIVDSETLSAVWADTIDIEISPFTGDPAVLYRGGNRMRFRALITDGTAWTAEYQYLPAVNNLAGELLATADQLMAMITVVGAPGRLFSYDSATWTPRNDVDWGLTFPSSGITLADTGSGRIALGCNTGDQCSFDFLLGDGTMENLHQLPPIGPNGIQLFATGGDPDLHVIWQVGSGFSHGTSTDGAVWNPQPSVWGVSKARVFASSAGDVFLSGQSAGNAELSEWNGAAWGPLQSLPMEPDAWPVCTSQPMNNSLHWGVFNAVPNPDEFEWFTYSGIWNSDTKHPTQQIWDATVHSRGSGNMLCSYGSFGPDSPSTGFYLPTTNPDLIPLYKNQHMNWRDPTTKGRTLDCSGYYRQGSSSSYAVFWAAYGPELAPVRITLNPDMSYDITELPYNFEESHSDWRRSVSAIYAEGATAVGLVCSVVNQETWFEWDNYGEWEDLPLPDGLNGMSLPELVKSFDGRWHIIYRDYLTDRIMCRSTL